jgi:hypothetical protein
MSAVENALITTIYERLTGADSHGQALTYSGATVPVYTGNAPADKTAPYVVIERPRTRGDETLDGAVRPEVREQLRVHTAFPEGKANHQKAYAIAQNAHDLLEAAPLNIVNAKQPYVPEPDKNPIRPYDMGSRQGVDVSVEYIFQL